MKPKLILLLFSLFFVRLSAQTASNLDVIYKLLDKSAVKVSASIGSEKFIHLNVTTPQMLDVLKPRIFQAFINSGINARSGTEETIPSVSYTLSNVKVEYKNAFTDGMFGATLVEREITVAGSLLLTRKDKNIAPFEFNEIMLDTLNLDSFHLIEQPTLPFTQAKMPQLPLLSSLWEPIIAVSTLIVSVILLFTVRSK